MAKPFLGRLDLRWCGTCNVPLIGRRCDTCGSEGDAVTYSPPGDVRPASPRDIADLRTAIEGQFAPEIDLTGWGVLLLNAISSRDGLEEVIVGGAVAGLLRERGTFQPRADLAATIQPQRSLVEADPGARASLLESSNLMMPGVLRTTDDVVPGAEVVITVEGEVVAVGRSRIHAGAAGRRERGVAVKVRSRPSGVTYLTRRSSLDDAVASNVEELRRLERRAVEAILRVTRALDLPVVVSFSGGKDSLATLLLVLEAGLRPEMLFVDTRMELPGTLEYVRGVADAHDLELVVADAGDAFRRGLAYFGPPAKDYRWCCKTNKLGPTALAIRERYPDGVLSFIGQRRYESRTRARSGARWDNPWVPGQRAFSPIQEWTSLHVWLYLLWKGADVNPWYSRGLERIGCAICPAADESEGALIAEQVDLSWWHREIVGYAREVGLLEAWASGPWRWRRPSGAATGADPEMFEHRHADALRFGRRGDAVLVSASDGDMFLLPILDGRDVEIDRTDAGLLIRGDDRDLALQLLVRAHSCVGCGICTARCPSGALGLEGGGEADDGPRLTYDPALCTRCLECLGPCPVVDFHPLRFRPGMPDQVFSIIDC